MRVFYDHQVFSLQDAGGVSRYQYELIRNLQLQADPDLHINLLMGRNASVLPFAGLRNPRTQITGWKTGIRPGYIRYGMNEGLSALMVQRWGAFDLYHSMLYRAMPYVRRRQLVVTHHDCTHERFPHMFHNAAFIMQKKRKLFAEAAAILCVSESSRKDLLHFYDIALEKTHVVHHGFTPLRPAPSLAEPTVDSAQPYLLYVGSRAEYKNFTLLLNAFALSRLATGYRLMVVGGGPFSPEEQAKISSLGVAGQVTLIAKADEATLAQAYRGAALFVYPSLYEGFGFPPLEAMSLGCSVLVYRTSSLPEVCGDAAFYFDHADAEDLSRALVSTLQDASGRAGKRQLGEQQVRRFDWNQTAAQTLDIYRALSRRT